MLRENAACYYPKNQTTAIPRISESINILIISASAAPKGKSLLVIVHNRLTIITGMRISQARRSRLDFISTKAKIKSTQSVSGDA